MYLENTPRHCEEDALSDEAIYSQGQGIASPQQMRLAMTDV
jgi:hypothetical protein